MACCTQTQYRETASKKAEKGQEKENANLPKNRIGLSLQAELDRTGVAMEVVQSRYKIQTPETMNEDTYNKVMLALSRTKSVKAA